MINILIVIAPLFLIILLGAILHWIKVADENWSPVLNNYALKIGFPALIFNALTNADFSSRQFDLIVSNSALLIISFVLAYVIGKALKLNSKNLRTIFICLGFGNVAYLGIPTLTQLYGQETQSVVSFIVAIYLFWLFTVGIGYLEYSINRKSKSLVKKLLIDLLKNPLLIAVVLGLLVAGFGIQIPSLFDRSIGMIAASVSPVVLIVIGLFIGKSEIGDIRKWIPVFLFSLMVLMLMPLLLYFGIQLFGYSPRTFSYSIIEAAMPLAITPFALADAYRLNKGFIARSIVMSTILSIVTISFWTSIL